MNHKRPPIPAILLVVLVVILSGYFIITQVINKNNGTLTASGTIEAVQVNIASEIAGKVTDVLVEEGQSVKKDQALLHLDPSLLNAQHEVAAKQVDSATAALATAQTNYDIAAQNALSQQQGSTAKDWRVAAPDDFNQPAWYFALPEQLTSAKNEADTSKSALEAAQADLAKVIADLNNTALLKAEQRLADARATFMVADTVKNNADNAVEGGYLQSAADEAYNNALDELRAAQKDYNKMLNSKSRLDVENARGAVVVAQQRFDAAYARYMSLQTGLNSPSVQMAQKGLDQAKAALAQAQANLALLDTQIAKLTISAPLNSVVLTRNVEPGEFVQPGATSIVLGQVNDLTITVFVPEDQYGKISMGQHAVVTVDSFPGITFNASVIQIADKAEFTPRNVQTVEGRSSTVFAIKLKVEDPDVKLRSGMPADVVFK
jgi:HlyD family secretion protein